MAFKKKERSFNNSWHRRIPWVHFDMKIGSVFCYIYMVAYSKRHKVFSGNADPIFMTRKNQVNRISPNFLRNIQQLGKQGLGLSGNLEKEVFEKTETCIRIGWKRNETDIHGNYQNEIIRTTAFILTLISLKTSTKFVLIYYDCLKSDPNLPKKIIICFNDSPSK